MADRTSKPGDVSPRVLWAALIGLLVLGLLLAVIAAEIGIRFLQERKYGDANTIEQQYRLDEALRLRVPVANLRLERIQTNSLGFRGPEIAMPKPGDTVRLAFLGASTTWCAEVTGNDKVWAHLVAEDLMRAFPGKTFDYVNGGVPGYVVRSSLKNLQARVAPLQPDIIVIYHATNDLSAELRRLATSQGVFTRARVESDSWLSRHSLLWNLAEKNLRIWFAQRRAESNVGRLDVDASSLGKAFRDDLTNLVREAQAHAKVVAVATFSTRLRHGQTPDEQLQAAASAHYYMPFMSPAALLAAYARYNEVIREVARDTGALLIEGEHDIPGDAQLFNDSVHFTDAGSRRMATRVAEALSRDATMAMLARPAP